MKHKFRRGLFGGYAYTIYRGSETFVSVSFKTPIEALESLRRNL